MFRNAIRQEFEKGSFKFKRPYVNRVEEALKIARAELEQTSIYLRRNNMKVIRGKTDDTFTEYLFYGGYEERRRYSTFACAIVLKSLLLFS